MLADALVKSLEIDPNDDAKKTPRAPFRVLDCRRNRLENGSAQAWAKVFSEHKSLVEVTMAHNSIRREGLEMIVRGLIPNPQLEYLDLENNTFFEMGDEAKNKPSKNVFPDIAEAVKSWPSLRTLNLSDCFLRTSGGEALFTQLSKGSNPKLEVLNICDNRINIGLRILATALYKGRLPALTSFEFGGNKANSLNRHSLKRIHDKVNEQRAKKGLPRIQKVEKGEDTNDDDEDEDDDLDDDTEAEEHQRKEDEEWEADEVEEEKEEPTAKKGYVDAETDRLADLLAKSGLSSS
jgi:Ran GTPase-activating protein 1